MARTAAETGTTDLDAADTRLLDEVQHGVPLERRPYAELGRKVGIDEDQCLERLGTMRQTGGVIRQISAIFDSQSLGYASSLVGARCDADQLESAAGAICEHPGVSHCYQRDHAYNLWYTLAVPPDSRLGMDRTIAQLHALSEAAVTRTLPTLRLFKVGVQFDLGGQGVRKRAAFTEADRAEGSRHTIDDRDKTVIRLLQQDLPLVAEPFTVWADAAGIAVDDLLAAGHRLKERRQMRRFSAVLRHRSAGFTANVMGVWRVPDDRIETCGNELAGFDAVTHCYQRPVYPDWPYNLFTMVHARSRDEAIGLLEQMRQATGLDACLPLWTVREFKKVRVRYFDGETEQWERRHATPANGETRSES